MGLLLSTVKSLISGYSELKSGRIYQIPRVLLKHMDFQSLIFLPAYCGSFKFINCALNRLFRKDTNKNAIMAGFLSGSWFMMYPQFTLNSFAFIRSVQLLWMKYINDYEGPERGRKLLKKLPTGLIVLWATTSVLFISRFLHPHMSSRYIVMCLNYITGSL